ncbi:MAG: hypothetical protein ABII21_04040 [bacterium]
MDYKGVIYLNGLTGDRKFRRISDYMQPGVADIVTFMSEIDAFGLPPLECSVAGLPCITAPFKDENGYPAFEYNYPGFSFVVDNQADNRVSDSTVDSVIRIANGSGNLMDKLEENARLAEELYGEQSMRYRLSGLLRRYGI